MKLRNKKTGEIIETDYELSISVPDDEKFYGCSTYNQIKGYNSIAELNEDWEDYEEPKDYWFIDFNGEVKEFELLGFEWQGYMEEIGNYFETREEAEKALEKLKAFKRLKDKGFKFLKSKIIGEYGVVEYKLTFPATIVEEQDLDLLFGGKE